MIDDAAVEAACRAYLNAEFDGLGVTWLHPAERANFIHESMERIKSQMRAALEAAEAARWRPIETAPKDGTYILAAHFAPGATIPVYAIMARWLTVRPSTFQCASKTWWHVEGPLLEEKTGSGRFHALYGFLPHPEEGRCRGFEPTHWLPLGLHNGV